MKLIRIILLVTSTLLLVNFVPKKEKLTVSQTIEKYKEIPVYISSHCKLYRTPKLDSRGESFNKESLPQSIKDKVRPVVIDQMNKGFKVDKFKSAEDPYATSDDWDTKFKGDIYMSIEILGEYKIGTTAPIKVNYELKVIVYFYERNEKGVFKKLKAPGFQSKFSPDDQEASSYEGLSTLKNKIKPDSVLDDVIAQIEKKYPKWVEKQFPKK